MKLKRSLKEYIAVSKKVKPAQPSTKKKKTTYRYKLEIEESDTILFIGEGNFSFALSLADRIHRADAFTCTSYDSLETTIEKYPESQEIISTLTDFEAIVLFEIDVARLNQYPQTRNKRYSKIIFNFPHVGLGIKDQQRNVIANQELISVFLEQAAQLLTSKEGDNNIEDGQILVTLKGGIPYDLWNVKSLGKKLGLQLVRSFEFLPSDYPGYTHRRTIGYDLNISASNNAEITKKPSRMYVFQKKIVLGTSQSLSETTTLGEPVSA